MPAFDIDCMICAQSTRLFTEGQFKGSGYGTTSGAAIKMSPPKSAEKEPAARKALAVASMPLNNTKI